MPKELRLKLTTAAIAVQLQSRAGEEGLRMKVPSAIAKSRNQPAFRSGCHEREKYTSQ